MNIEEKAYLMTMAGVKRSTPTQDRTNTGTLSVFGRMLRFDLSDNKLPLFTSKKIVAGNPIGELLWMMAGNTDLISLRKYQDKEPDAKTIWCDDFKKFWERGGKGRNKQCGGAIYSKMWRDWEKHGTNHDQLATLIADIKKVVEGDYTNARRLIVTAWNPAIHSEAESKLCALPPCHDSFQCIVKDGKLNLRFSMRSNDMFLGLPYNIAFYATLTHILAKLTGLEAGELVYFGTDVHLYSNHLEQADEQLRRTPTEFPTLELPEFETLEDVLKLTAKDFVIKDYNPQAFIKAPQAS